MATFKITYEYRGYSEEKEIEAQNIIEAIGLFLSETRQHVEDIVEVTC